MSVVSRNRRFSVNMLPMLPNMRASLPPRPSHLPSRELPQDQMSFNVTQSSHRCARAASKRINIAPRPLPFYLFLFFLLHWQAGSSTNHLVFSTTVWINSLTNFVQTASQLIRCQQIDLTCSLTFPTTLLRQKVPRTQIQHYRSPKQHVHLKIYTHALQLSCADVSQNPVHLQTTSNPRDLDEILRHPTSLQIRKLEDGKHSESTTSPTESTDFLSTSTPLKQLTQRRLGAV